MTLHSLCGTRYPASQREGFLSMQRALQKSLDEAWGGLRVGLDVMEDETAFHVTADLPGLTQNEVDVSFDDGLLTIRGEKKIVRDEKKDTWHITERSSGSFARKLSLNAPVEADKIEAKFEKGVLTITLPKQVSTQNSAKKIEIKTG